MSTVAEPSTMTTEQMLALPDNDTDRDLIRGQLRESPITFHDMRHSSVAARISCALVGWHPQHPQPGACVASGEPGFRLMRNPDTTVGIDIAFVSAEVVANSPENFPYFEGPPVLAVEILSPSDSQERIDEKVSLYREAGVPLIWIVNPVMKTVMVVRAHEEPVMFNVRQELSGEPELPGFLVPVAEFFRF